MDECPNYILTTLSVLFGMSFFSEHEPQFWGFETVEEWLASPSQEGPFAVAEEVASRIANPPSGPELLKQFQPCAAKLCGRCAALRDVTSRPRTEPEGTHKKEVWLQMQEVIRSFERRKEVSRLEHDRIAADLPRFLQTGVIDYDPGTPLFDRADVALELARRNPEILNTARDSTFREAISLVLELREKGFRIGAADECDQFPPSEPRG
jgi:hypothetical protein